MSASTVATASDWMWLHGGKGSCQLCGAETKHGALLMARERRGRLFLCRDCAPKLRSQKHRLFARAVEVLELAPADPSPMR